MNKRTTKTNRSTAANIRSAATLPAPFTKEDFQADVLETFLHHVRLIGRLAGDKSAWQVISGQPLQSDHELFYPDNTAADLGLKYRDIQNTPFAQVMDRLFDFAYLGRRDANAEAMNDDSDYSWIAAILTDARNGAFVAEWDAYGPNIRSRISNCHRTAETADARAMLEYGEGFWRFEHEFRDGLSVRQLALLSGLEEMSIRAAANPRRPNPLKTFNADGATRIALDVAKEWLISKGRYVPVTTHWSDSEVDLTTRRFNDETDLFHMIDARREAIGSRIGAENMDKRLSDLGIRLEKNFNGGQSIDLSGQHLMDGSLMLSLAVALELPPDLFVLRTQEMLANQKLKQIERQLREVTQLPLSQK